MWKLYMVCHHIMCMVLTYLWSCRCKCKTLWNMVKAYRREHQKLQRSDSSRPATPTTLTRASSVIKRKGKPKLSLAVPPKPDQVDGPSSSQPSVPSLNGHLARTKWLNDDSVNVSFEYHKFLTGPHSTVAGPSTGDVGSSSSAVNNASGKQHVPRIVYHKSFQARIARNYYFLQSITLLVAFVINLLLLNSEVICCHSEI